MSEEKINSIFIKVPTEPSLWGRFSKSIQQNSYMLTKTMAFHNSPKTTYNMEDLAPMMQQCEQIMQSCNYVYEDIVKIIAFIELCI